MYKNEELDSNPFDGVQSPKVEEKLPKALTPEDVEKLLSFIPKTPSESRDKAFLELLYSSGLRVSEAINVNISSFESDFSFIRVIGKGKKERMGKNGKGEKENILLQPVACLTSLRYS